MQIVGISKIDPHDPYTYRGVSRAVARGSHAAKLPIDWIIYESKKLLQKQSENAKRN